MSLIVEGKLAQLLLLLTFSALSFYFMNRAKTKPPYIRSIAALEAIPEVVGRAAEMNRPVLFTPGAKEGWGLMLGKYAGQIISAFSVMGYVAEVAARMEAPLIITTAWPETQTIIADVVRNAYRRAGKEEAYSSDIIRYWSPLEYAYVAGTIGILKKENVASFIQIGPPSSGNMLILHETAAQCGCMQIGGTARGDALPFPALICDYVLMGEECMTAGAMLSGDNSQLGTIQGSDFARYIMLALLVLGFFTVNLGIPWIIDFLKM